MAILTQGTNVYLIDPADDSVITVACATAFNPGGAPADQIETTCLESTDRTYSPGLRTPGQASLTINADPTQASHTRMQALSAASTVLTTSWAIGWSDGTAPPTVDSNGDWVLPTTRTWYTFDGYIADFPFDFALNSVVSTDISIQRSGVATWTIKTP